MWANLVTACSLRTVKGFYTPLNPLSRGDSANLWCKLLCCHNGETLDWGWRECLVLAGKPTSPLERGRQGCVFAEVTALWWYVQAYRGGSGFWARVRGLYTPLNPVSRGDSANLWCRLLCCHNGETLDWGWRESLALAGKPMSPLERGPQGCVFSEVRALR